MLHNILPCPLSPQALISDQKEARNCYWMPHQKISELKIIPSSKCDWNFMNCPCDTASHLSKGGDYGS
jgi:hypothetical protein